MDKDEKRRFWLSVLSSVLGNAIWVLLWGVVGGVVVGGLTLDQGGVLWSCLTFLFLFVGLTWISRKVARASISVEFVLADNDNLTYNIQRSLKGAGEVAQVLGFLVVHNTGNATVKCQAFVSVNSGFLDQPTKSVQAYWYGYRHGEIEIKSGDSRKIVAAIRMAASWNYRWIVPYLLDGRLRSAKTNEFFRSEDAKNYAKTHISVVVKTDLPLVGGYPTRSISIEREKIHEV